MSINANPHPQRERTSQKESSTMQLKNRFTSSIIYSDDATEIKVTVNAAIDANADLRGADLYGAKISVQLIGLILIAIGVEIS